MEAYVWNTELEAQEALDYVNGSQWLPLVGKNAETGELEPTSQKTELWCSAVGELTDGRFFFPRMPSTLLDAAGIPQSSREAFVTAFSPSIEDIDPAMIVVEGEL